MKFSTIKETYFLSNEGIDSMSQRFYDILTQLKYEKKSKLAIRLNIEEYLLGYQNKFGEETKVFLLVRSKLGELSITFSIEGDEYDPMRDDENSLPEWNSVLMQNLCVKPSISYSNNQNHIQLKLKKPSMNPALQMLISIVVGVAFGLLRFVLDLNTRQVIEENILNPVCETFLGVLSLVGLMLVLLSVITSVLDAGDISTFNSIGKKITGRFMLVMSVIILVTGGFGFGLFKLNILSKLEGASHFFELLKILLNVFPGNIIKPFYERNPIQIMLIGFTIGISILALGNSAKTVGKFFKELYSVELYIMEYVQKFLLVFISLVVTEIIWTESKRILLLMLNVVIAVVGTCTVMMLVDIFATSLINKTNPFSLIKKVLPTFLISLTASSSSDVYGTFLECCERKLGIEKELSNFGIAFSAGMFKPGTAILYLISSLFFAKVYDIEITPVWMMTAFFICFIMAIATPPVTGGSTVSYTVVFLQLGIPNEALAVVLAVDIIFDFYTAATNKVLTCTSLLNLANKNNLVDRNKLI